MAKQIEILSERTKIPSDGKTATKLCLRFGDPKQSPGQESEIMLRLSRGGSFDPDQIIREKLFAVVNGEVVVTVYAPRKPGSSYLQGEGFRHRIEFIPASFWQGLVYEWVPTMVYALAIALVLRSYAVASFIIPSGSMQATLQKHDLLIANKFSYKLLHHEPQRGDIMIFKPPHEPKKDYIKRVIGLPGDTVEVASGIVYINGEALAETYINEQPREDMAPKVIPEGEFFMMGDNRNHSLDSRAWGTVKQSKLEGRALFIFWPPNRVQWLVNPLD